MASSGGGYDGRGEQEDGEVVTTSPPDGFARSARRCRRSSSWRTGDAGAACREAARMGGADLLGIYYRHGDHVALCLRAAGRGYPEVFVDDDRQDVLYLWKKRRAGASR
jgi:hypothetical protein